MLAMLHDLVRHKKYASVALMLDIRPHEAEAKVPESWEILTAQYQETHKLEQQ